MRIIQKYFLKNLPYEGVSFARSIKTALHNVRGD